ncbi:MAG: aldehyde dehydrogenase family protein [Actinobacteria bacterium]|nr:MAG: aldehyde dehydrogenase family protein [Actinomycetota bacterium]
MSAAHAHARSGALPPFANERHLELRRGDVREALLAAGGSLLERLPLSVPVMVGEQHLAAGADGRGELVSPDPGKPRREVARAAMASGRDVDAAVRLAPGGHAEWAARSPQQRAETLIAAACLLRERRLELAALAVYECAKPWLEADADVCEAIDFLEYYARRGLELERDGALAQPPGERNSMRYVARGVVGVIAPWNFPFAIPTGMSAGALAAGNAVVLKPAEQSPACAQEIVSALRSAGVPAAALALLPGDGRAGEALVRHPGVHAIAFTGSCEVGLQIVRAAAETPPAQRHLKRVVAEMGGKNCVIVDSDADLDQAVPAIVRSAYGYAGQKCSAAARVLAHEAIAAQLIERLAGAVRALRVGQADELGIDLGPLIDADAQGRAGVHRGGQRGRARACAGRAARRRVAGRVLRAPDAAERPSGRFALAAGGGVRAGADGGGGARRGERVRCGRRPALRADGRAVQPQPGHDRRGSRAHAGGQPVPEPRDHRGDGRSPAVRRQPPVGHGRQGGRPGLPARVQRAAGGVREHDQTRRGGVSSETRTPAPFVHPLRVRYAECDPQQIVFNANYFAYFDVGMTELWRAAIGSYAEMMRRGVDMVVAEASARFLGAARFDDALQLEVSIARLGRTACTTRHRVLRKGEVLVEGMMRHVFVDPHTLEKLAIPAWLRESLAPWVTGEPGQAEGD